MRYLCILLISASAYAHDVWLEPARLTGGAIELRMRVGEPFIDEEAMPFEPQRIARALSAQQSQVREMNGSVITGEPQMIAIDRVPFDVALNAEEFNTYLEDEGHYDAVLDRMKRGESTSSERERVTRHLKTFIGSPSADPDAFLQMFGTKLEIVPLSIPAAQKPFSMRIMFDGRPLRNARISLFGRKADGTHWQRMLRTDRNGVAAATIVSPGFIVVRVARLERCRCDVDYTSDWAALTFTAE